MADKPHGMTGKTNAKKGKTRSKFLHMRIDPDLKIKAAARAAHRGEPLSEFVTHLLKKELLD